MSENSSRSLRSSLAGSARRVTVGVLIAIPLVAILSLILWWIGSPTASIVIGIAGVAMLQASETFESRPLAGIGGVLAFSGVFAWAILTT